MVDTLAAGRGLFAGYPIAPANETSERMAEAGGAFLRGEDKLCSIFEVVEETNGGEN